MVKVGLSGSVCRRGERQYLESWTKDQMAIPGYGANCEMGLSFSALQFVVQYQDILLLQMKTIIYFKIDLKFKEGVRVEFSVMVRVWRYLF